MVDASSPSLAHDPWNSAYHAPVLVNECLALLGAARRVLDGTLGGGGHAAALLAAGADVIGVDRDPRAIAAARTRLADAERAGRFRAVRANYADISADSTLAGERFDGILLDLGVSSHQLDDDSRGFSFREGAPLDMRMDAGAAGGAESSGGATAATLLNEEGEAELGSILREYADEPRAMRLAREIVRRRTTRPFRTSDDLVGAIRGALGARSGPGDFARIFQGLRIAVNHELTGLERALPALRDRLTPGGTLAVIAYHSGEDRLVKHSFRAWSASCTCPPRQFHCTCGGVALGETITRRAISAGPEEQARNPRSRSARLRGWRSAR